MTTSTSGPVCPYCEYTHRPDKAHYYDEDFTSMDCHRCDMTFSVRVSRRTTWTRRKDEDPE